VLGERVSKNQKLIEKNLEKDFPNSKIDVVWEDSPSGPPITNNMIAGKTQVGFFGDMPLLVNGSKGQTMENYDSIFIAMDGKGKSGKNQAILINKDDAGATVADLAGKTVSTPFGSSAHRMLLAILEKNNLTNKVDIINQDVSTGLISVESKKVYAHATWDPYPRHMVERGKSVYLVDGKEKQHIQKPE
jgi:NitT/TauT family transport system substrate-binding protein